LKTNVLTLRGGVNTSNNATFRLCDLKSNLMFLLCRIKLLCHLLTKYSTLCHPEFSSGSQEHEILKQVQNDIIFYFKSLGHSFIRFVKRIHGDNVFNIPSYRTCDFSVGQSPLVGVGRYSHDNPNKSRSPSLLQKP